MPRVATASLPVMWILIAFSGAFLVSAYMFKNQVPEKEYVFREVPVQVEKPSAPAIYPSLADKMCSQAGPTFPPANAPQQGLPPVPINPSFSPGLKCYDRPPGDAEQVGILTSEGEQRKVLPFFAQRSPTNRNRYHYWTRTGDFQPIVVSVRYKGRDCMSTDGFGCDVVYTGDKIHVPAISDQAFVITMYRDLY